MGGPENGNFPLLYVVKMSLRRWVVQKSLKTPLRNIKMALNQTKIIIEILIIYLKYYLDTLWTKSLNDTFMESLKHADRTSQLSIL